MHIVDDNDAFRASTASVLNTATLESTGYSSAQAFLHDFDPSEPACALIDLEIPDMDGPSIQARLHDKANWLPVIYTTTTPELRTVTAVMRAGAWHVLEKSIAPRILVDTVCDALNLAVQFHEAAAAKSQMASRMLSLSGREREIFELLIAGYCSREIANKLGNSPYTVEKQRANLMHKLHVKTLPALAMLYYTAEQDHNSVHPPGFFWWLHNYHAQLADVQSAFAPDIRD